MTTAELVEGRDTPVRLRAQELLRAGTPWAEIKEAMRLEANARIAAAALIDDEDGADLAYCEYASAVADVEGWIPWEEAQRELAIELGEDPDSAEWST